MDTPGPQERTIVIRGGSGSPCRVLVGAGLMADLGRRVLEVATPPTGRTLLLHDAALPMGVIGVAERSLRSAGLQPRALGLAASEMGKSLATLDAVLVAMAQHAMERGDALVAVGGGVVGDVGGLAAAMFHRGTVVVQCPTTLLAMVDASVGGKTAVNLRVPGPTGELELRKNLVGVFHQPALVLADVRSLESLGDRHLRSGLAECVKHTMLADDWGHGDLGARTDRLLGPVLDRDEPALVELVERNVAVKAAVVEADEHEDPARQRLGRMALNLGHTFGHALEVQPTLSPTGHAKDAPLLHGEAVALGLVSACAAAIELGMVERAVMDELRDRLARAGLASALLQRVDVDALVRAMQSDKKTRGGKLRLVLPCARGRCAVVADPPRRAVEAGLRAVSGGG